MKLKSTLEILKDARLLIEKPEHWTTKYQSVDANGCPVPIDHPSACKFCSLGALDRVDPARYTHPDAGIDAYRALLDYGRSSGLIDPEFEGVSIFNDTHTHAEVLELFNGAIQNEAQQ